MDKRKKKKIKQLIALGCAAVVVLLLAVMPLLAKQKDNADGPQASILSGTVAVGTVEHKIVGGGTLTSEDAAVITVPSEVKLTKFLTANGDAVKKGDALASVDRVTVMTAITQVQETMDQLAKEIEEESSKTADGKVTALAGGTVKVVYAQKGDMVQEVMLEHGALAVLSLDGLMAVDMTVTSQLTAGTAVTVTLSDGKTVTGEVETNVSGNMTVTLEDKNYPIGESVQVSTKDGTAIGSGKLYVYSPWNATAYAGTVSSVKAKAGDRVAVGETLLKLTDTGHTAAYHQLIGLRQEYEDTMLELFQMYQTEQVSAPCDGVVSGIDKNSAQLLAAADTGYTLDLLANAPNGDDVTLYKNFVGRVAAVADNGWAVQIDPQPVNITDYKVLSGMDTDTQKMTQLVIYNPNGQGGEIPVYELVNDVWVQSDARSIAQGDMILFAGTDESNIVWTVRLQKATQTPSGSEAITQPGNAEETPSAPGNSEGVSGNQGSSGGRNPNTVLSGDRTNISAPSQNSMTEQGYERYDLAVTQIASVTPQDTMIVDITIDEADITALKTGMPAQVRIDALGGEKCSATISDIGSTGTSNGGNSKYTVRLTMDRTETMLAGMHATTTIVLSTTADTLTIPVEALAEEKNITVVYTGYDEKKEELTDPVTVDTGVSDGKTVQILDGLQEGAVYYYAYYDTLEISATPDFGSGSWFGRK